MIDTANLKTANRYLKRARAYADDLDLDADLDGLDLAE